MSISTAAPAAPAAPAAVAEPLFIADDLALNFVNTRYGVSAGRRECLNSDEEVLDWLRRAGLGYDGNAGLPDSKRGTLLKAALELRETALDLLSRRKAETVGNPAALNRFLALDDRVQALKWKRGRLPELERRQALPVIEAVLVPVADAIARLLTEGDFDLVRKCESSDCTLWFYDRTKAHHRRWCSMALCGNRAKVAAYRARQSAD
jgi:predicted RNA-binding Zn ribbon-like protein